MTSILRKIKEIFSPEKEEIFIYAAGYTHNLQEIYHELNVKYFEERLDLRVSWFGGESRVRSPSRKILGYYKASKKIIKIHKLLDHPDFPPYFISFIMYHEMLHALYPPFRKRGRWSIHHSLFKQKEREFEHYHLAKKWQKENRETLLTRREYINGRS